MDTNVWYSAVLYGGRAEEALRRGLKHCDLVVSPYLIDEIVELIKLDTRAPYRFVKSLRDVLGRFILVEDSGEEFEVRDPKDQPIARAAINAGCLLIVTGDEDLLTLEFVEEVAIVNINDFLAGLTD